MRRDVVDADAGVEHEEDQHDGRKGDADLGSAVSLNQKHTRQDGAGDGNYSACERHAAAMNVRQPPQHKGMGEAKPELASGLGSRSRMGCGCVGSAPRVIPEAASWRPSTAETTDTAGVSTPSPAAETAPLSPHTEPSAARQHDRTVRATHSAQSLQQHSWNEAERSQRC